MTYRSRAVLAAITLSLLALVGLPAVRSAHAQNGLCFPQTNQCIAGRFREYWEQNGGLAVFGYPITPARQEQTAAGTFLTQYFERNRFELHPEKAAPYDVLLGRLGDDELRRQGLQWQDFMAVQQADGCLWFSATRQTLCDDGAPFKTYWESHGLADPSLNAYQRSLALFGMPLSSPHPETNTAGDTVVTQWFERARFEYHPANPSEFKVLLGLLGNESRAPAGSRSLPAGAVWIHTLDQVRAIAPSMPGVTLSKGMGLGQVAAVPDGSLVVYYQHTALAREGGKLWTLDARTGQRRVLYEVPGSAIGLRFSPDGARLALTVVGSENWQLVELDVRTGRSHVLGSGAGNMFLAPIDWTPGGLVVNRLRWGTDAPPEDVMLLDPSNGATRTLYRGWHWGAAVDDAGRRVAIVTGRIGMGEDPEMSLLIVAADTGRETTVVSKSRLALSVVEWSPDNARLAYRSSDRDGNATLHVVNADGSGAQSIGFRVSGTPGRLMDVRWRDRSTLVMVSGSGRESRVYEAPLSAFTVAGLKQVGSFAGGSEAYASILYVPRP